MMTEKKKRGSQGSEAARASSAQNRVNIALNMRNWRDLDEELQQELLWFHQHCLDNGLTMKEAGEAISYDNSTVYRVLHGNYQGNWDNIKSAIRGYRKTAELRGTIQQNEIVRNGIVKLIHGGLDYAMANNSITLIIGESRMGKTVSAKLWRDNNNHGRSVYVTAPPVGGAKTFLRRIAAAVGVNKNLSTDQMFEAVERAFNSNRMLIIDEAHRLLPNDYRSTPVCIEILRDIHDMTGCALALVATERFNQAMQKSKYQYEQVLGRIGMPVRLKREIPASDIRPIISQYIDSPGAELLAKCKRIANDQGRLGILTETLKVASRIANKAGAKQLAEEHIFKAIDIRNQMMGEHIYAAK
jgi:DNA transposition AAA+ family ATPase